MNNREKVIKELHDARRYLEDKEWSDRGASPHIDAINDALAMLKQEKQKFFVDESGKITPLPVVVRCKDCKYGSEPIMAYRKGCVWCERIDRHNDEDWFCADGERAKDDEQR